ncbi:hypothetical protein C6A37_07095, partial [Desulfobacteraceae bacterium SEEP-SAG9]
DWVGRPIEFQTAVLSSLMGIKLSPASMEKLKSFEMYHRKEIAKSVHAEMSKLKRRYDRNEIDKSTFQKKGRELLDLKKHLLTGRPSP